MLNHRSLCAALCGLALLVPATPSSRAAAAAAAETAAPPAAPTTRPVAPAPDPRVAPLLKELGDVNFRTRQAAEDKLIEIGEPAIPELKALLAQTKDDEVRIRAQAALRTIEESLANGPTLITLHLKDAPVSTVIEQLSRQAGTEIATWPPNNRFIDKASVTIDVDKQPFWLVVREICQKANFTPQRMGRGDRITLMHQNGQFADLPYVNEGRFLITAVSINRQETVDFANPKNPSRTCSLRLQMYADPRVKVLRGGQQVDLKTAVDDKGNSLVMPRQRNIYYGGGYGGTWIWSLNVPLVYEPAGGKMLTELRGTVSYTLQTRALRWEIDNPLKAKDLQKTLPGTGITFTVKSFAKQGGEYELHMVITQPANTSHPATEYSTLQQSVDVLDSSGRSYMNSGGGGGGGGTSFDYKFRFAARDEFGKALGNPDKVILEIPTAFKEIEVPIELKNLPLP